jgi:multiple sugar transport system ATP-binding protein
MRTEIKKVHQKVMTTTVYVTHDQVEAMTLADRVVVMNQGRIDQIGTPHELYHTPRTKFVAGFIGSPAMNFVPCRLVENAGALTAMLAEGLSFRVPAERTARYQPYVGRELLFGLRPEHMVEHRGTLGPGQQEFEVTLDVVEPMGMETMVYFLVDGVEVCARVAPEAARDAGERMRLVADLRQMHLIDPTTEEVL